MNDTVNLTTTSGGSANETPTDDSLISDEEAKKLVDDTFADYEHGRKPFERQWYRSILFLMGNQWIIWDVLENKWRKKRLADWVPTPVTNKYASGGQRLVSVISRIEPNWRYTPVSDSSEDIEAAKQCKTAEDIICEENRIEWLRQSVAPWLVYTGNCFLLSGADPLMMSPPTPAENATAGGGFSESGASPMQPSTAPMENMMDQGQNGTFALPQGPTEMPMMPPAEPQITDYKLYTDVLAPFEVYLDQTIEDFDAQVKIMVVNRRSKEYVKNLWGVDVDEMDISPNVHYQESIGYITSSPEITGFLASLSRIKRITIKRLFVKPNDKYPQGLYIVVGGGKILEKKPLPTTPEGVPFVPMAQMKFDNIPGAAFGRTPMDDIIHKQVQRNKIESLIELIALRMGSPIWLMPEGTVLRNFAGEPGAIVNYSLIGDKASKPDRIPGEQIPTSIVQFLANIDKDIEDLISTFEALKGQSPYSGAPGVVIEQLIEQGLTRFGPSLRNVAEGYRQWMKHQLELFRKYGISEKVLMKQGEGSTWSATKFRGADIAGAVDVRIESDSTVPRSSQVEVAKILEAVNAGLVDITSPTIRQKILQKLKIQDLQDDIELDMIAATKENELMLQNKTLSPVNALVDNHEIHIYKHRQFANSEQGAPIMQILQQHIAEHTTYMQIEATPAPGAMQEEGGGPSRANISKSGEEGLNPGTEKSQVPSGIQ